MIKFVDNKKHLLLVSRDMSKERFLKNAKVKEGSYMFNLLGQIYNALTACSVNLKLEYQKYYSEYDTFYDFLSRKYPVLTVDDLKQINEKQKKRYVLYKVASRDFIDYSSFQFFDDDEFMSKVLKLLG